MFRFSRFAFPAAFAAMVLGPAPGAADSFTASVSQREVVTGDPFRVVLEWQGSGAAQGEPALENPDAAPLSGPSVSSSMFNYNGRVSQTRSWSWTAFAERDGEIDFGTAKIVVGGRTYTAEIPVVKAGPPPPQPFVRLSMASDKAEVLVDEEFTVAVTLDVAAPARLGGALPFAPRNPPLLRIPHLGGGEGFGPCRAVREPFDAVKDFVVRAGLPGVRLNSFARRDDPFEAMGFGGFGGSLHSAFGEAQPYVFAFPAEEFAENGTNYLRQTVAATFRAEALGECVFPAARFEGAVIAHVGADGRSARLSPPVVALSPGVRVKVVPPPAAGRPDAFFGALGTSLSPSVSLDTQSCRQGDPIELTLRLDGDLVPSTVGKIDIFSVPGIAESFRAWGDAERRDDGAVPVFHFKVRPVAAGTLEIPPIPLAYFDTVERAYKVVATDPVPLRVDPVADFDPSALFAAAATNDAVQRLLVASSGPVAPSISLSDAGFAPRRIVSRRALAALFIAAPAAWLLTVLLPVAVGGLSRSAAALRKGRARSRAEAALRSADSPQRVMEAVRALLRDRWGEDVPGMTPSDLREALARHGVGGEDARRAAALVQEVFDEAFSPGAPAGEVVKARRGEIAQALAAALRVVPVALALAAFTAESRAADPEFLWRSAAATAGAAAAPEDFLRAAREYRALADEVGAPSATLLANLGATLLQAGCRDEALDAFRRVEALEGASAAAEAGIALAGGGERPVLRTVLFWHYRIPLGARWIALAAAWCVLWFAATFSRLCRRRPAARRFFAGAAAAAAVFCALLATSVAASERLLASPLAAVPESVPVEEESGEN